MKCCFTGRTDPGLVRPVNQDHYYTDPKGRFFIVADGMGGHAGGQEASQLATEAIRTHLQENWESEMASVELLEEALDRANEAILADQAKHPERQDMGTTMVAIAFRENRLWFTHIGDSRLYRWRNSKLEQITDDHTWVAKAMKAGDLSPEQARSHPWRHVLSQCLGRKDLPEVEVKPIDVQVGDRLLLCSDGLTEEVSDKLIAAYLESNLAYEEVAENLIESAKENGGRDNITVVIVGIDDVD